MVLLSTVIGKDQKKEAKKSAKKSKKPVDEVAAAAVSKEQEKCSEEEERKHVQVREEWEGKGKYQLVQMWKQAMQGGRSMQVKCQVVFLWLRENNDSRKKSLDK